MPQPTDRPGPRRIGHELKRRPPAERLNPEVIRAFLHEFVSERFNRNATAAAEAVESARPKPGRKGHYRSDFRPETLYDLIHDRARLKYYQLESIAHFYQIPVSALLLFTRLRSELEDTRLGASKALDLTRAFRRFVDRMEAVVTEMIEGGEAHRKDVLSFSFFEELASAFPEDMSEEQRSLPF